MRRGWLSPLETASQDIRCQAARTAGLLRRRGPRLRPRWFFGLTPEAKVSLCRRGCSSRPLNIGQFVNLTIGERQLGDGKIACGLERSEEALGAVQRFG